MNALKSLDDDLRKRGSYLVVRQGKPLEVLQQLVISSGASVIYAEEDFTPYARQRDFGIAISLPLHLIQGQLVHHPSEIHKADGNPYKVYTPFSKRWKIQSTDDLSTDPLPEAIPTIQAIATDTIPEHPQEILFPASESHARKRLRFFLTEGVYTYQERRNRMDTEGTSVISPYLHFGILGLRAVVQDARDAILTAPDDESRKSAQTWLNELIWREFYIYIL